MHYVDSLRRETSRSCVRLSGRNSRVDPKMLEVDRTQYQKKKLTPKNLSDNTFVFNNLYFYIFQTWGFLLLCQFFYIYKEYLQMSEGETDSPAPIAESAAPVSDSAATVAGSAAPVAGSAAPVGKKKPTTVTKKSKKKTSAPRKRGKSLREDQMELDSAFAEKIVMKNDNEFHCKDCPIFVTSIRLLARTHAQSCSSKKKKAGRKPKKISCAECGAACEGRKGLANHFKVNYIISSYNCSQCPKTFKSRKNFANHLKIHDETVGVKCPHCPKIFKYESYKRRHVQRVHKAALNPPSVSCDVVVELNLNVRSKEDWNDWFHMSGIPNLPVSSTGLVDEVELAV